MIGYFSGMRMFISIHSLRMEGDGVYKGGYSTIEAFQSTPSAWRETHAMHGTCRTILHFNPLPPHGGRHDELIKRCTRFLFQSTPSAWRETYFEGIENDFADISIHSLRMEGDLFRRHSPARIRYFNPLPPHGGRLAADKALAGRIKISIHSLRMEGDLQYSLG